MTSGSAPDNGRAANQCLGVSRFSSPLPSWCARAVSTEAFDGNAGFTAQARIRSTEQYSNLLLRPLSGHQAGRPHRRHRCVDHLLARKRRHLRGGGDHHRPSDLLRSGRRDGDTLRLPERRRRPPESGLRGGLGQREPRLRLHGAGVGLRRGRGEHLLEPPVRPPLAGGCSSTAARSSRRRTRWRSDPRLSRPGGPVRPQGRRHAGDDQSGAGSDFETGRSRDGDRGVGLGAAPGRRQRRGQVPAALRHERHARRDLDRHRRLQQLRAERGGGRSCRDPRVLRRFPGAREHRKRRCPRQHRDHRDGGADLLAELLDPGQRQFGPLRRQLGQREPAHQRAGDNDRRRHLGRVVGIDRRRAQERSKYRL